MPCEKQEEDDMEKIWERRTALEWVVKFLFDEVTSANS